MGTYRFSYRVDIDYDGDGDPDPIVKTIMRDVLEYDNAACDVWIGDKLYAFSFNRMYPIEKPRGLTQLYYTAEGEYVEPPKKWSK